HASNLGFIGLRIYHTAAGHLPKGCQAPVRHRNDKIDQVSRMSYPMKTCVICGEEFELKPDKPGFANRCLDCTEAEAEDPKNQRSMDADERRSESEANAERRRAIKDLLYRKDS